MPKIPISGQNQILAASNPVPIAGTNDARFQGEQIATFGKGLMDLAGAQEHAKDLLSKVQMEEADAKFDGMSRDAIATASSQINENPGLHGMDARNQFVNSLKDQMNNVASGIENPLYKRLWAAKAQQKLQAFGEDVGQVQLKAQVAHIGQMNEQVISSYADLAATDPARRDEMIIKSREAIDQVGDQIYTPINKQQLKDGLARRIDTAIFEKMIVVNDNNTADSFNRARKFVDSHVDSFSVEGIDKVHDKIDKAEYAFLSHDRAQIKFNNYMLDQKRKEVKLTNDAVYGEKIFNPNTSPLEKKALMDQFNNLVVQGLGSRAVKASFDNAWKTTNKDISAKTQVNIYSQALNGLSFNAAEKKVQEAMNKDGFEQGALSAKDGYSLLGRLRALERSPEKKQLEQDGEKLTRAAWSKEILDDPTLGQEYRTQMENAVYYYHQLTQQGINPNQAANLAREKYHKAQFVGIGKGVPVEVADDLPAIQKELAAFAPAYSQAEKNGNREQMKILVDRKKLLLQQMNVLQQQEAQNKAMTKQAPKDEKKSQGVIDQLGDKLKGWFNQGATQ